MLRRKQKYSLYVCKVIASVCGNIRKRKKKRYVSQGGSKRYRVW